ncbi:MAG: hypothetical protein AB1489_29295, partial [Acidobacteriota bacterium]
MLALLSFIAVFIFATPTKPLEQSAALPVQQITYTIKPVLNSTQRYIEVELYFKGTASGQTRLNLPSEWGGEEKLYQGITGLEAISANVKISDLDKPEIKLITHRPNQFLRVKYRVV